MKTVRFGIIGLGNIGRFHADYLLNGKIKGATLAAISDAIPANLERYPQIKSFPKSEDLLRSGLCDAVIIATPHYLHTTIGIDALERGLHVLVEKPISVHKADCERLLAAHKDPKLVFAAMFQLRTDGKFKKLKQLVSNGELGELFRVSWIISDWYRTEAYYASGGWRATWKGEGGGVLLNQCPHNLDLMQWICGRPSKVRGFCQLGRYHAIEVEDNVTAYLEWPNGATGVFITSTGEAPGTNRFEICGDRGKLVLEQGKITFTRNEIPMREFSRTSKAGFARPEVWNVDVPGTARSNAIWLVHLPVPFWPALSSTRSTSGFPVSSSFALRIIAVISIRYESRSPRFHSAKISAISSAPAPKPSRISP